MAATMWPPAAGLPLRHARPLSPSVIPAGIRRRGGVTRVGTATKFGVNEGYPRSLATHNGILYMAGSGDGVRVTQRGRLYRLTSTPARTTPYTYNPSGSASTRPHAVTRAGTKTYSYDANGNMLLGDGRIMTYDYENRLSTVRKNGATTTFVYDGDGGRVKKTVTSGSTTTTTTYIGKLYVCEGTSCSRLIYAGSQRIALVPMPPSGRTPSPSYFHPDHLGSTSVLTNAQGAAEEHNSYRPYGQLHTHTGTADVAYKYTGQERDPSTGLYFYNARYYDPALGRFISPDTLVESPLHPQTLNRYAYAGNNPVLYNDPTGPLFPRLYYHRRYRGHGLRRHCQRLGPGGDPVRRGDRRLFRRGGRQGRGLCCGDGERDRREHSRGGRGRSRGRRHEFPSLSGRGV